MAHEIVGAFINPAFVASIVPLRQIVGLIPFTTCDEQDCRYQTESCCYLNPVFGDSGYDGSKPGYTNDFSTFLFEDKAHALFQASTLTFTLQRLSKTKKQWDDINTLGSTQGEPLPFGSFTDHPNYAGYKLNWGSVIFLYGSGIYRVKVISTLPTAIINTRITTFTIPTIPPTGITTIKIFSTQFNVLLVDWSGKGFTTWGQVQNYINSFFTTLGRNTTVTITEGGGLVAFVFTAPDTNYINSIVLGDNVVTYVGISAGTTSAPFTKCMTSEPFNLLKWDCNRASTTVKFEANLTGQIGDKRIDYLIYDLDKIDWYDSIRVFGFFGKQTGSYTEVMVEHGRPNMGRIERIRDEVVPAFTFYSDLLPQYIHERFMTYGMMADTLMASDYNINNSDYDIKRMLVIKDGGYEPTYYDKELHPNTRAKVKVEVKFKKQIQSVIKSLC